MYCTYKTHVSSACDYKVGVFFEVFYGGKNQLARMRIKDTYVISCQFHVIILFHVVFFGINLLSCVVFTSGTWMSSTPGGVPFGKAGARDGED